MKVIATALTGVKLIEPEIFADERGVFYEGFSAKRYLEAGIDLPFVQDNVSYSKQGVLRGLHYQTKNPQGKLVTVIRGRVFDVAVDIRYNSPNFGSWFGVELNDSNHRQLYIPPGFAHGFCVLSGVVDVLYYVSAEYSPGHERGILWSDTEIGVEWPVAMPEVSVKDASLPLLKDADNNFTFI